MADFSTVDKHGLGVLFPSLTLRNQTALFLSKNQDLAVSLKTSGRCGHAACSRPPAGYVWAPRTTQ